MHTRRFFIGGLAAACALGPRKLFAKEEADFDDTLLVFLFDVHAGPLMGEIITSTLRCSMAESIA